MHRPVRVLCLLFLSCLFACLLGCGDTPLGTTGTTAVSNAANLSGNWLLAGSLPMFPASISTGGGGFGLTATFDVTGSQVTGIVTEQISCSGFTTLGGAGVVAGTVAADGSFTLTSQITNPNASSVTLTGKAPASAGGSWSGTYTITTPSTTCSSTTAGTIAATSLPPVTGTYTGTSSFPSVPGTSSSSVTLKLALQQGGTATNVLGNSLQSNTVLTGAIAVQGSNCYTSGTTTSSPIPGAVEGNTVLGIFAMNDGSVLQMIGATSTTDSSKLIVEFITTTAGSCPVVFSGSTVLAR